MVSWLASTLLRSCASNSYYCRASLANPSYFAGFVGRVWEARPALACLAYGHWGLPGGSGILGDLPSPKSAGDRLAFGQYEASLIKP